MGSLKNGGYLVQSVPTGPVSVSVLDDFGKKVSSLPLEIAPNQDYYVKWSFQVDDVYVVGSIGGAIGNHNFQLVEKEFAIGEVEKLNGI